MADESDSGEVGVDPPEHVKSVIWGLHHWRQNRELLTKRPVLGFAVAALVAGFFIGRWDYFGVLDVLREENKFKEDQLVAYRDRLQGATPDEAAKRFSTLEKHISDQDRLLKTLDVTNARHLTDIQKDNLKSKIDRLRADVHVVLPIFAYPVGDSALYAADFMVFFSDNKINTGGIMTSTCASDQHDVMIGVKDPHNPPENAKDFAKNLTESGIRNEFTLLLNDPDDNMFDIFVCPATIDLQAGPHPSPMPQDTTKEK